MKAMERMMKLCGRIIRETGEKRREGILYNVTQLLGKMTAKSRVENFVRLFLIEYVVYGNDGECGLAVFFDRDYHEVLRVLFEEDDEEVTCWTSE